MEELEREREFVRELARDAKLTQAMFVARSGETDAADRAGSSR
jgi:hypothetical protein